MLIDCKNPIITLEKIKSIFTVIPWNRESCDSLIKSPNAVNVLQYLTDNDHLIDLTTSCAIALYHRNNAKFYEWFEEHAKKMASEPFGYDGMKSVIYKAAILTENYTVLDFLKERGYRSSLEIKGELTISDKLSTKEIKLLLDNFTVDRDPSSLFDYWW